MSEPQPSGLNYQSAPRPGGPKHGGFRAGQFFLGLALGTLFSAVVWIAGWDFLSGAGALGVPLVKSGTGVGLLLVPGRWSAGGGVLVSLALGFLIFFGTCASHLKF